MKIYLLFFILISVLFTNCKKDNEIERNPYLDGETIESLEFGWLGDCMISPDFDCTKVFKISDKQLFADNYEFGSLITYDPAPLNAEKYTISEPLLEIFPKALAQFPEQKVGKFMYADQDLYYVKIKTPDLDKKWFLDPYDDDLDSKILEFRAEMITVLDEL